MPELGVTEASEAYAGAMRNIAPAGPGICAICWTFIDPAFTHCYPCNNQPAMLDAVVPITYSEHLGQMHTALRNYKDGVAQTRRYAAARLAGILWRFLDLHEACVARAAYASSGFTIVAAVPSSTRVRDEQRSNLRWMIEISAPVTDRFERVLQPTDQVPTGRDYDERRYTTARPIPGADVLLIDDTWAAGGHAQSAAHALKEAGANRVALVVIGRHVKRSWEVTPGTTSGDLLDRLPRVFDWTTCATHAAD